MSSETLLFWPQLSEARVYVKVGRISEGSEKKLLSLSTYNSTSHRKRQWQKPHIFQIGGYVLASMLLCSTSQFWKNGTISLTQPVKGSFLSLVLFICHTFGLSSPVKTPLNCMLLGFVKQWSSAFWISEGQCSSDPALIRATKIHSTLRSLYSTHNQNLPYAVDCACIYNTQLFH